MNAKHVAAPPTSRRQNFIFSGQLGQSSGVGRLSKHRVSTGSRAKKTQGPRVELRIFLTTHVSFFVLILSDKINLVMLIGESMMWDGPFA
jgi:hypothetical protein